jgi:ABC-type glycerol-3-phosphate transport system substrate-binding protein
MILSHWPSEEIRIASEDGKYNLAGNKHYTTLLTWLKEWYQEIAFQTDDWSPDWQPAFQDSVIAGDLVSQWMDGFLPGFAPEQKGLWGKTIWPEFNRYGSEAGGGVAAIPKGTEHPEAAFAYLARTDLELEGVVREWAENSRMPKTKSGKEEVLKRVETYERPEGMSDEDWTIAPINFFGKDFMDAHFQAMDYIEVFPYDPMASAELDILRKHTEAYMGGSASLEEALSGAQADMEAQLGNPYEG